MRKLRFRDVEQLVQVTYWLNWKQFCSLSSVSHLPVPHLPILAGRPGKLRPYPWGWAELGAALAVVVHWIGTTTRIRNFDCHWGIL